MSKILKEWEWKYQVFFDEEVQRKTLAFAENLKREEKALFLKQLKFYKSFYTIDVLIEALKNKNLNQKKVLEKALENKALCAKTDQSIYELIKAEINFESNEVNNKVLKLLDYSLETDYDVKFINYLMLCFHIQDFKNIIEVIYKKANQKQETADVREIKADKETILLEFNEFMNSLMKNESLISAYGSFDNSDYDVKVEIDSGYGEWWDKDLYEEYDRDTLILYSNDETINSNDFHYTIIHEVYPGHGHFFRTVKKQNDAIDTGASLLIEGYATYTEINSLKSAYTNNLEIAYAKTIINALNLNYDVLNKGSIRLVNQKKGYLESYFFGCFAIEYYVKNKFGSPKSFLEFLSQSNKGDFYKLW